MNYESLVIGSACFVAVLMVLFAVEELAKSKSVEVPSAPLAEPTPVGNPDGKNDKWGQFGLIINQGRLNSGDEDVKEVIRQIKNEYPDGWVGKLFPDV